MFWLPTWKCFNKKYFLSMWKLGKHVKRLRFQASQATNVECVWCIHCRWNQFKQRTLQHIDLSQCSRKQMGRALAKELQRASANRKMEQYLFITSSCLVCAANPCKDINQEKHINPHRLSQQCNLAKTVLFQATPHCNRHHVDNAKKHTNLRPY